MLNLIIISIMISIIIFFVYGYDHFTMKRNMSLDLRCEPPNPKNNNIWPKSSIDYHYRPKCFTQEELRSRLL